ncbi:MAG: hypothetical protein ACRDSK_09665 [Actinophytocola sp.]|uniref:hypothetical protein n=1 Tax=Actinophytocola sp. TaxID=1872138 RepID=UPI003D6C5D16
MTRRAVALVAVVCATLAVPAPATAAPADVFPSLRPNLVAYYDFEHPAHGNPAVERDLGRSHTVPPPRN